MEDERFDVGSFSADGLVIDDYQEQSVKSSAGWVYRHPVDYVKARAMGSSGLVRF